MRDGLSAKLVKPLASPNQRVVAGHARGTTVVSRDFAHASAAVGRRSSTPDQWDELCELLEDGQPWTPQEIHTLIEDHYGVTYHPTHLARKLRAAGMHYAKPRPMDPRSPDNAEEILAERLGEALGEDHNTDDDEPVVVRFFR